MAKYRVKNTSILHNGTVHKEGSSIELTENQAKRLEDFVELLPNQNTSKAKSETQAKTETKTQTAKNSNKTKAETKTASANNSKTEKTENADGENNKDGGVNNDK